MSGISLWLTALPVLLAAAVLTWAISVPRRNVTIVDTLWPLLFVIAAYVYAAAAAVGTASGCCPISSSMAMLMSSPAL